MVRRLIEEQYVGFERQFARQRQPPLPSTRKRARQRFAVRESRAPQGLADARRSLGLIEPLAGDGRLEYLLNRLVLGQRGFLLHVSDAQVAPQRDLAGIGRLASRQNLQQRRFSRAVRPDQPDPVAFGNGERDAAEQSSRAEGLR